MQLRDYQLQMFEGIFAEWAAGKRYVLAVLPTGGGKTVTFAHVVKQANLTTCVLAHRAELVAQMSLALAREGIRHRIVGPKELIKLCSREQLKELKFSYYDPSATIGVASVQSINSYHDQRWLSSVGLWVHDEAHHLLRDNQFGRAVAKFPNAKGLGVTATPGRADGRGLGAHSDGFFEAMVMGPTCRELINRKFLSEYKIFAPPSNLNLDDVRIGANGEFNPTDLRVATKKSTVLGDVVQHYTKHALGKLGLTFADSIENAGEIAERFRNAGVPAEVLTGKSHPDIRSKVIEDFKNRKTWQIVSVALIDEGFDCPAVEVVSDGAATESFNRFAQRFGRGLRKLLGKSHMIYFDHVGNTIRHGLPDAPRSWSLDRRERRNRRDPDEIPLRVCIECLQPYERTFRACPYCGYYQAPDPSARTAPEFVDGDLMELDPDTLKKLRGEIVRKDGDFRSPAGLEIDAQRNARTGWLRRQDAQRGLRNAVAWWAGVETARGYGHSESMRRFFYRFGVDVANAQLLGAQESDELARKVLGELAKLNIDGTVNAELYFASTP